MFKGSQSTMMYCAYVPRNPPFSVVLSLGFYSQGHQSDSRSNYQHSYTDTRSPLGFLIFCYFDFQCIYMVLSSFIIYLLIGSLFGRSSLMLFGFSVFIEFSRSCCYFLGFRFYKFLCFFFFITCPSPRIVYTQQCVINR